MNPTLIDLNDYIRTGEGANGASYNHKADPSIMMKLYFRNYEAAALELELAQKVYKMGIPTPEPGDLVTDGKQVGIRFKRVEGKKSYSRACGDNPERAEEYGREFAQLCKKLHSVHVDTTQFESVKERYLRLLEENPFFTVAEKDSIGRFIADAPDTDTAIHGDLQFSNAIFVGDKRYFIDLGDFCYGYSRFDLGMVFLCCRLSAEDFIKETFHMPKTLAGKFWECFATAYFGSDRPLKDIEEEIMPYAGLKTLIIERDVKMPMPEFREALKSIL